MQPLTQQKLFSLAATVLSLPLLAGSHAMASGLPAAIAQNAQTTSRPLGAVYTMTNATAGNQIVIYPRAADGRLGTPRKVNTGGKGTGTGLGNQSALILNSAHRCLYAVNAGSNDISAFTLRSSRSGGPQLSLVGKVKSGGLRPVSLALNPKQTLLYALNAGGTVGDSDNVSGFKVKYDCTLSPLASSKRPLSAANTAPAQVGFTPDGKTLIVTEKATNKIDAYRVASNGTLSQPDVQPSAGATPFGFAFGKGSRLFVSEAAGGAPQAGSVSSYGVRPNGQLRVITPTLAMQETATCWVVISKDGRFAYVTNTGSETVSSLKIGPDGKISLLKRVAGNTGKGTAPIDLALSANGRYLYVLDNAVGSIVGFRVNVRTGELTRIQRVTGLPAGANGTAAW